MSVKQPSFLTPTTATPNGIVRRHPHAKGLLRRRAMGRQEGASKPATRDGGESSAPTSPRIDVQSGHRSTMAEAIAKVHGGSVVSRDDENGVLRMKIVVTKQQLRQMMLSMGRGRSSGGHGLLAPPPSPQQVSEQLLHVLRRRHMKRAAADAGKARRSPWAPALQSIPEEM